MILNSHGVGVVVDKQSLLYLKGAVTVDYDNRLLNKGS